MDVELRQRKIVQLGTIGLSTAFDPSYAEETSLEGGIA